MPLIPGFALTMCLRWTTRRLPGTLSISKDFLGAKMSLQFVWQGYDSLLAAPLVLDMVRLAELAKRRGEAGLMPHLASFFKAPLGVDEHRLFEQFQMLLDYVDDAKRDRKRLRRVI